MGSESRLPRRLTLRVSGQGHSVRRTTDEQRELRVDRSQVDPMYVCFHIVSLGPTSGQRVRKWKATGTVSRGSKASKGICWMESLPLIHVLPLNTPNDQRSHVLLGSFSTNISSFALAQDVHPSSNKDLICMYRSHPQKWLSFISTPLPWGILPSCLCVIAETIDLLNRSMPCMNRSLSDPQYSWS